MTAPHVMPAQKPGRSWQEVGTPAAFLRAVEGRFGGPLVWDLAANRENSVCGPAYFGPDSFFGEDALAIDWSTTMVLGLRWLNPEYSGITPWAAKCARESTPDRQIAFLVPASVGSNWFADHVWNKALVLFLRPRLTFVGHTQSYPKDLILAVYGVTPGCDLWKWKGA